MAERKYADLVDHLWGESALILFRMAPSGRVLDANPSARRYIKDDFVDASLSELLVDCTSKVDFSDPEEVLCKLHSLNLETKSGTPATFSVRFIQEDPNTILAIGSPDVAGLEKYQREVSHLNMDLSNLGRELAKANAELKKLNRLKNQFLGMAAHDLRNPLTSIYNAADLLREDACCLSKEDHVLLGIIVEACEHMQQLVDYFLDVAVIESGSLTLSPGICDVEDVFRRLRDMISPCARAKGVHIEYDVSSEDMVIQADSPKILQVLLNLTRNAIEHSVAGSDVQVSARREGDRVLFSVSDEAGGIPPENRDELFKPFMKAGTRKTGKERSTGLGLAIAKMIVDQHHGEISEEGKLGQGATFIFSIPATFEHAEGA